MIGDETCQQLSALIASTQRVCPGDRKSDEFSILQEHGQETLLHRNGAAIAQKLFHVATVCLAELIFVSDKVTCAAK